MTTAKKIPAVKTQKAVEAASVIAKYAAVDNLAAEERRFYREAVLRISRDEATDDDRAAAKLISEKFNFDIEADARALAHIKKTLNKYFGDAPESDWQGLIRQASKKSQAENEKLKAMRLRHAKEQLDQGAVSSKAQYWMRGMAQSPILLTKLQQERPHLFAGESK